jgi:hypothetical protein
VTYYNRQGYPIVTDQPYSWLRQNATRQKVAGSRPDGVIDFFNTPNPSNRTIILGLTQPVTKMSNSNLLGGRGVECGRCVILTTLPSSVIRLYRKYGIFDDSEIYRPPRPVTGIALLYGDGVCFLWGTNCTVSTATSSQYLAVNCEQII